jgi:HD-GYP domain-containing protein (c-di-GMP phosphodiesterase class II)
MKNSESFPQHPEEIIQSDIELNSELHQEAKKIASRGNFSEIKRMLIDQNLLTSEMSRVREQYKDKLSTIEFLNEKDLEILTILELYDEDLLLHSLETYRIAKEKSQRNLAFDVKLVDLFEREGVKPQEFFRACLLHDIGKVEIPNFIINNNIHNNEMKLLLRELVIDDKDSATLQKLEKTTGEKIEVTNSAELEDILYRYNLRSVHFVPVKSILRPDELEVLKKQGFDLDLSIMDIIKQHEEYSRLILEESGLEIESKLAGSHHNYHGNGSPFPLTLDALNISVDMAELIRIADMTEALTASRSYNKEGFSLPRVLRIILEEERTSPEMTYIWLEDDIRLIESQSTDHLTLEDLQDIDYIKKELEIIKNNLSQDPFHLRKVA